MSAMFSSGDAAGAFSAMSGGTNNAGFEQWFQNYQAKKVTELNKNIQQKQVDTLADPDRVEAIDETEKDLKRITVEADSLDILQRKAKSVVSNLVSYNMNSGNYMELKAKVHGLDPKTGLPHILTADEAEKLNGFRNSMLSSLDRVKDLSLGRDFKTEFRDAYDTNHDAPDNERVTSFNTGPWNKGIVSGRKKLREYLVPPAFKAGSSMSDQIKQGNIANGGTGSEGDRFATYTSLHLDSHVKFSLEQDRIFSSDVKHANAHIAYMKNKKETTLKRLPRDHLSNTEMKKLSKIADKMKSDLGVEMTRLSDGYDNRSGQAGAVLNANNEEEEDQFNEMLEQMNKEDDDYYESLMDDTDDDFA